MIVIDSRDHRRIAQTQALPGSYYTDATIFAMEQAAIFEEMWFCAVRSADLDKPGAFKTVQVGRESVLLTRSRGGEVRAFFNVCRHRGAQLCTEESGEAKRAFQCPYHAWTYDFDGKLIAAPNLTKMPDIDRVATVLVALGGTVLSEVRHAFGGAAHSHIAFVADPDGNRVELISHPDPAEERAHAQFLGCEHLRWPVIAQG